jgi:hypothetical protein
MNFLYLSPHFPANYQAFCLQLRHLGATVLGIADLPYDLLSPELKCTLSEYYQVENMQDYQQLFEACRHFTERYGKIDRLDSHAEYWLETEARLRTDFNIKGIKTDTIQTIKRKSHMKTVYREAGVIVARGEICHDLSQAIALVSEVGYPIIAKPDIGVGAANTFKLKDEDELKAFFLNKPESDYIFEEFVSGELYSFDGITDQNGELQFFTSHYFCKGIMDIVRNDEHIYYYSLREIPQDLEEAGRKVLSAFNVRERFFHFEFFRRHQDNQLVALEVNIRPPGGPTTDMFNYANDIDIYREWANIIVNNRFEASWSRPYHALYIGRKHRFPYVHSHQDILERYQHLLCHHEPVSSLFASALGDYGYIIRSPHLKEILEVSDYVLQMEIK